MIEITPAQEADASLWNSYLEQAQVNNHAFAWQWRAIISGAFGHQPYYLIARDMAAGGKIAGVLPIFLVKSFLFGKAFISVPYLNAGGIIADSETAFTALRDKVQVLGRELGVDYIELRHRAAVSWPGHNLQERTHKVSMLLSLQNEAENVFSSFPPKLRSQIRRPTKSGMYAQTESEGADDSPALHRFYGVFAEHMRDLGTPVYPRTFFSLIKREFGSACRSFSVLFEGKVAAAGITIGFAKHTEMLCASALRKFNKHSPNMLLYWQAMKTACADGYQVFDFGRSSYDSTTYRFKAQWGASPLPLYWYYDVINGEIPDINPKSSKFSTLVECWKHMPLAAANLVGPWLTRSLP